MQCRLTNIIIPVMRSMSKEEWAEEVLEVVSEMEDLVEVEDKLFVTTMEHLDTTHETVPTPPQYVSIASPMIMLLKNILFYKISGRKRDRRWETKMSS